MRISDFSSLALVLDPRYPTNLAILLIVILSSGGILIAGLIQGENLVTAITGAIILGITVFLTWAVGREIDPEHEFAAFAGLILVLPGYWFLGAPDLVMVLTMLLLLRILNRSTGVPTRLLDSLSIIALGALLLLRGEWIFGFLCAAALFLDSKLAAPMKRNLFFAGIMVALTIISLFVIRPVFLQPEFKQSDTVFLLASIMLFIPLIRHTRTVDVTCDYQPEKLNPTRVQVGQVFAISSGILVWLFSRSPGLINLLPLWCSILGVSMWYLSSFLLDRINS